MASAYWTAQALPEFPAPTPCRLPLFAAAIGGLGLLGWRRRRRASVNSLGAAYEPHPDAPLTDTLNLPVPLTFMAIMDA
jgi:hypothetical protein